MRCAIRICNSLICEIVDYTYRPTATSAPKIREASGALQTFIQINILCGLNDLLFTNTVHEKRIKSIQLMSDDSDSHPTWGRGGAIKCDH